MSPCATWLSPSLFLLLSLPLIFDLPSSSLLASAAAISESSEELETEIKPFCYRNEPCTYAYFRRRSQSSTTEYTKIKTWCRCTEGQKCKKKKYDKRRKTMIYVCKDRPRHKGKKHPHREFE